MSSQVIELSRELAYFLQKHQQSSENQNLLCLSSRKCTNFYISPTDLSWDEATP
jgi:hypothetical protein